MVGDEEFDRSNSLKKLKNLLKQIDGSKVTLIGDTMLDRYHHGFANNLTSTAPVPVVKIIKSEESPGASAHIALGLNSLGMNVEFHCSVGDDNEGKTILKFLSNNNINTDNIFIAKDRKTLTKIRFFGSRESLLDRSQILLQADRGPQEKLREEISIKLFKGANNSLKESCALVISDYDKGVIIADEAQKLINRSIKLDIPVIVDPKLTGLEKSIGATVVLFEIRGLELLSRRMMVNSNKEAAFKLIDQYNWKSLLVLGGINGVTLYENSQDFLHIPCMSPSPEQQIGLHDAAATALAAALGHGMNMRDSATLAAAACECVLSAQSSMEFVDLETLGLWLDELSWKMQISDR